jgi:serine/threonine protein phosphatase PrpC
MIRTYSFTDAGGYAVNEDAFLLQPLSGEPGGWLVALADGQGGRAGGARAAQLACQIAATHAGSWKARLTAADAAVAADAEAGFTTLVGLHVHHDRVAGASCGDSAALAVWGNGLLRLLTANQFKNPPVGSGEADFVPFELELTPPWRVLVMSDGVWKYAGWERIWDLAARLSGMELLAELQTAARLRTSGAFPDDFTVVLLESE